MLYLFPIAFLSFSDRKFTTFSSTRTPHSLIFPKNHLLTLPLPLSPFKVLLRPAGARWTGERSPRHRGCALRACLLPELLSASGASQYHHTHCPTSANAAGTADPINNPTLRSDSDAGWGGNSNRNRRPTGDPHVCHPLSHQPTVGATHASPVCGIH